MPDGTTNGWNEYSRLVLKELETLASSIEGLRAELQEVKQEIAKMQVREELLAEIKAWKEKVDEVASPSQMLVKFNDVEDLKIFKTKAITIFAVVQFLMAFAVVATKVFG